MKRNFFKYWKTTIMGVVGAIVVVLGFLGITTPDESAAIETATETVVNQGANIWDSIEAIVLVITSTIAMFLAKDKTND